MPGDQNGEISVDEQSNDNKKKTTRKKKNKQKQKDVDFEKGNQLLKPSIWKTRKRFIPKITKKPKSPNRCSSHSHSGFPKGGCFSIMRTHKTEESSSSPPSDPNDESFTHEMLRVMLETNDFWSSDCNPHR